MKVGKVAFILKKKKKNRINKGCMKHKQSLWMSNLSCGIVCSVTGSLTGSFCCDLCSPFSFCLLWAPPCSLTLFNFFPHLSFLFFLHSSLWLSSTTIFYCLLLFLITCFYFFLPVDDSHSDYSYPAPSDSPSNPFYCSSLSSPPPFIPQEFLPPF